MSIRHTIPDLATPSWLTGWLSLLSEAVAPVPLRRYLGAIQRHSGADQVHLFLADESLAELAFCEGALCCALQLPAAVEDPGALRYPLRAGENKLGELILFLPGASEAPTDMEGALHLLTGLLRVAQAKYHQDSLRTQEEWQQILIHDLRSPLATLRAYLDLLAEELPTEGEARQFLAAIQRSAQQQDDLFSQLLSLHEVYRKQSVSHPLAIQPFLAKVLAEHQDAAALAGLRLGAKLNIPPDLQLDTEEPVLRRALFNLLENAIRYTPAGGRVQLRAEQKDGRLWLRIRDDGPGVPLPIQERIFLPFERAPVAGVASGTGLGLAFTKAAAERLGGELSLEKTKKGSAFVMSLPLD